MWLDILAYHIITIIIIVHAYIRHLIPSSIAMCNVVRFVFTRGVEIIKIVETPSEAIFNYDVSTITMSWYYYAMWVNTLVSKHGKLMSESSSISSVGGVTGVALLDYHEAVLEIGICFNHAVIVHNCEKWLCITITMSLWLWMWLLLQCHYRWIINVLYMDKFFTQWVTAI